MAAAALEKGIASTTAKPSPIQKRTGGKRESRDISTAGWVKDADSGTPFCLHLLEKPLCSISGLAFSALWHSLRDDNRLYDFDLGRVGQEEIKPAVTADFNAASSHERRHYRDGHLHSATGADAVAHGSNTLFAPRSPAVVLLQHGLRDSAPQGCGLGWILGLFAEIQSLKRQQILHNAIHRP